MRSLVSIIIPHFNRTELLQQTLRSIAGQTCKHWEVIIVDDQSDLEEWNSIRMLASDKIKVRRREIGIKGPSACRNLGADEAMGEYLIFLDADDLLAPHCLEQRVLVMKENEDLDAGVFLMEVFENSSGDKGKLFNKHLPADSWAGEFVRNENPWNVTGPIWKRESFLKIGFDENLFYMEDPDLHLRAIYQGLKFETFYHLPPDCYYRVHHFDDTKSSFYRNSILYRILFYQKLTGGFYSKGFVEKHKTDIKAGVNNLIRTFLYSRLNQFPELYNQLIGWMKGSELYSPFEIMKYRFLLELGNTTNILLKALRVKGICYRLLP